MVGLNASVRLKVVDFIDGSWRVVRTLCADDTPEVTVVPKVTPKVVYVYTDTELCSVGAHTVHARSSARPLPTSGVVRTSSTHRVHTPRACPWLCKWYLPYSCVMCFIWKQSSLVQLSFCQEIGSVLQVGLM